MKMIALMGTVLLVALAPQARAQVIFSNGVGDSSRYDNNKVADAAVNNSMTGNVFTTTSAATINYLEVDGIYGPPTAPPANATFTLSLYSTVDNAPDTLIASSTVSVFATAAVGNYLGIRTVFQFSGLLATPLALTAGTTYYVGIQSTDDPSNGFAAIYSNTGPSTNMFTYTTPTGFQHDTGAVNFEITQGLADLAPDPTPEPSTWALLVVGVLGVVVVRKRALLRKN